MVEYKILDVAEAADIALKNRLYVSGWCLSGDLKDYRAKPNWGDLKIVLAYDDDKPVGVVVDCRGDVQAFVRKSHRRRGIASGAIRYGDIVVKHYGDGINGSEVFFEKMKVNT